MPVDQFGCERRIPLIHQHQRCCAAQTIHRERARHMRSVKPTPRHRTSRISASFRARQSRARYASPFGIRGGPRSIDKQRQFVRAACRRIGDRATGLERIKFRAGHDMADKRRQVTAVGDDPAIVGMAKNFGRERVRLPIASNEAQFAGAINSDDRKQDRPRLRRCNRQPRAIRASWGAWRQ